MSDPSDIYKVDPDRFEHGRWSAEFNKRVGEGDIAASYSGDTIASQERVRRPFVFHGELWVNVAQGNQAVRSYRLAPIDEAGEDTTTYAEKTKDSAARSDPRGFYHGTVVRYKGDWFVMIGPPARFVPRSVAQPGLFGDR